MDDFLSNKTNDIFLIDAQDGNQTTYREHYIDACKIAAWLEDNGFHKGSKIGVISDNSVFLAKFYFGCLYAGVVVVPINPDWSIRHIDYVLTNTDLQAVLIAEAHLKKFAEILSDKNCLLVVPDASSDVGAFSLSLSLDEIDLVASRMWTIEENQLALIVYTSGTTADPKGVVHTIGNLVNNGSLFIDTVGIKAEHRFLGYLPMTYLGGYYNLLLIPYLAKSSVVISPGFSTAMILDFWDPIIRYQVTAFWFVPSIISILLLADRNAEGRKYCQERISLALIGTAPLRREQKKRFEERYGIKLYENYGLSETLFIATQSPRFPSNAFSVGHILPGVQVDIVNKHEAFDLDGEIAVKPPYLMKTYYGKSIDQFLDNQGYFLTGDIGRVTGENELILTDRKKDLIIRGGINISPLVIEEILYQHPAVELCAVVGVSDDIAGEEIVAVIKLLENQSLVDIELQLNALCETHLAVTQRPSAYLSLAEFPCTSTGKIQKAKIKTWAMNVRGKELERAPVTTHKNPAIEAHFFKASKAVLGIEQAISVKYNTMVYERKQQGKKTIVLSLGEAFFDIPLFDFSTIPFPSLYHYSHSRGVLELREKLAEYFKKEYEVAFDPEKEIIITAGSKIAIYMTMAAILNPDDEVLVYEPAWVSYFEQIKLCSAIPVSIPYWESVYDFEKYITNRTRLLIINNPNNPRGSVFTLDELVYLYQLAQKYNLFILSDEAYSDFVDKKESFISLGNIDREKRHTIICNSISKNFGISGWRIGYIITNSLLIDQVLKLNQHLITCPATILEYYVAQYFDEILRYTKPQIKQLNHKRRLIQNYMDEIGLAYLPGEATFYFFVSIEPSLLDSDTFSSQFLEKYNICVVPGIGYGVSCDKFVRVSIGAESLEVIQDALLCLKQFIERTSRA